MFPKVNKINYFKILDFQGFPMLDAKDSFIFRLILIVLIK